MMTKNDQAVALVTGASSGIGEATAVRLAEAGYRVRLMHTLLPGSLLDIGIRKHLYIA